jgi:hypothetical protein
VAQEVECLPSKHKALSSNLTTTKKNLETFSNIYHMTTVLIAMNGHNILLEPPHKLGTIAIPIFTDEETEAEK